MAEVEAEISGRACNLLTNSWKKMSELHSHTSYLEKKSATIDTNDPYWRVMVARTALKRAEDDCLGKSSFPPPPQDRGNAASRKNPSSAEGIVGEIGTRESPNLV